MNTARRWFAFCVFVSASSLNYLDRFLLNQLGPLILADLHFNKQTFGWLLSFTAVIYAVAALFAGWLLDRFGVDRTMTGAVAWWSLAGMATATVRNLPGLFWTRGLLAAGESAGIPAVSKINGLYLRPDERALGTAINGLGLSVGLAMTPWFISAAQQSSWRRPFLWTGAASLLWIPLWLLISRAFPAPFRAPLQEEHAAARAGNPVDWRPLVLLVGVNVLWMGVYSFWSSWTTFYLIGVYRLTLAETAKYSWIPLFVSNLGGLFGGWLSRMLIRRGASPVQARQRAVYWSAAASLAALLLPLATDPRAGTALISLSFFFGLAGSVNIYAVAIDLYGAAHAGMAVAAMTFAYGLLQAIISPWIGRLADLGLYHQAVWGVTMALVASALLLTRLKDRSAIPHLEQDPGR